MLNKAFDIYFFFFFSSKKTQTADTSSVDETLILVGTNFVTGPVTLIQNYSLLKLVIIQSSMHLRQIQKIPNWQQFYILQVKMCSTLFHRFPCCTWSSPKTSFCTVTEMILCRGISGLHWTALEHHNLDYDLYNLPFLSENLITLILNHLISPQALSQLEELLHVQLFQI